MKRFLLLLWKFFAVVAAGTIIVLALAVGLFRLLLPLVPEYHDQIETAAGGFLNRPVELGSIDARWRFGGPELTFTDATIYTPDGSEVIARLKSGSVGLSVLHYLKTRQLRPGRVTFDGVEADILRTADNRFLVSGRQVWPGQGGKADLPNGVFALRDAKVTYTDEILPAGARQFDNIDINLAINTSSFSLEGSADLPAALGGDIEFSGDADGDLARFEQLEWQGYLRGDNVRLGGWGSLFRDSLATLTTGNGNLELHGSFHGATPQLLNATVEFDTLALSPPDDATVAYAQLAGRLDWKHQTGGWKATAQDISIERNGRQWRADGWQAEYSRAGDNAVLYANADFARTDDLMPLVHLAPDSDWKSRLLALDPAGDVVRLQLRGGRDKQSFTHYALQGNFDGLGWEESEKLPGARGLTGMLRMDEAGGRLEIEPGAVAVSYSRIMPQVVASTKTQGTVIWRRGSSGWRVLSDNFVFDTKDFACSLNFEVQIPGGDASPNLDLQADVRNLSVPAAASYLPEGIMKPALVDWLRQALVAGEIPDAALSFAGPVRAFPFEAGEGHFRADLNARDVSLQYHDKWPMAHAINGKVIFSNLQLEGSIDSASILSSRLGDVQVNIADLREAVLKLTGRSDGGMDDVVQFLRASPIQEALGPTFARVEAAGAASVDIDLALPIRQLDQREVSVAVTARDASLGLSGMRQTLSALDGTLHYTNAGITASGMIGNLLGNTVTLDVAPETFTGPNPRPASMLKDVATVVTVRGVVDAIDLAREFPDSLAQVLDGVTDYTARARFPVSNPGQPDFFRVTVDTNLAGMAVGLPAPLEKPANTQWPVIASAGFPASDRLELKVERGQDDVAQLAFRHDGAHWKLVRGAAAFGGGVATLPTAAGVVLAGEVPFVDLSGWLNMGGDGESGVSVQDVLLAANLSAKRVRVFGQEFADTKLELDRSDREWLLQVRADRVEGSIFVPFDLLGSEPVIARLEKLHLVSEQEESSSPYPDPRQLPALNVTIKDFNYDEMQFGGLSATVRRSDHGLLVESAATRAPSFFTQGSGAWTMIGGQHRSQVEVLLESTDMLATLASLDFEPSIDAKAAEVKMSLHWPGPPGRHFREQLNGEVRVDIGDGQLNTVQPGAGRMFGLLSVAELPRRLSLDFRDVFDSGFGFDFIRGDFTLTEGNAYTSNLVLDGPAAQVGVVGRTGIAARDYDQTAVVHASFGSTLPVAGAIAAGPAVGAALLIFSEIFKKPLQNMVRVNYRITGSWDDPEVQRVLDSELDTTVSAPDGSAASAPTADQPKNQGGDTPLQP